MSEIRFYENENGLVIMGINPTYKDKIMKVMDQLEYLSPVFVLNFIKKPFKKIEYEGVVKVTNQDLFEFIELLNSDTSLIDRVLMKIKKSKQIVASIDE